MSLFSYSPLAQPHLKTQVIEVKPGERVAVKLANRVAAPAID